MGSPPESNPAEVTTKEVPVSFKSSMYLVSAPVVVRDSKGRAVGGLEKNDFQLLKDGKPQIVSGFSVENFGSAVSPALPREVAGRSGGAPGAGAAIPTPSRFLALVFDDLRTDFADLIWARQAAEKFLSSVPPSERVALYTTSGQVAIDFTSDREEMLKKVRTVRSFVKPITECLPITYFLADRIRKEACAPTELDLTICPTKVALAAEAAECSNAAGEGIALKIHAAAQRALAEGDWNTRQAIEHPPRCCRKTRHGTGIKANRSGLRRLSGNGRRSADRNRLVRGRHSRARRHQWPGRPRGQGLRAGRRRQ